MKPVLKSGKGDIVIEKSDAALVDDAIQGDADSFTELCRRYYPAMVAIAHAQIGDRHLAEDVAQEAFAKAAGNLNQLKDPNRFSAWTSVICRNIAKSMDHPREKLLTAENLSLVPAEPKKDDWSDVVREAIGNLSPDLRELVFLRYYDGMSYERISEILGISEQAINGRLRRAKKKMAKHLRSKGIVEVTL